MTVTLLVDVGSTLVKLCEHQDGFGLGSVRVVSRRPDLAPGEQVCALVEQLRPDELRVCSSAGGGLRVGLLGLSQQHSMAAATEIVMSCGGDVVYQRVLGAHPDGPVPPVDLLVLAGGVNGADLRYLRDALAATDLSAFPHDVLVWAGADASDLVTRLPVHHVVANVLDNRLRPSSRGLADLVRHLYLDDLVDRNGLKALAEWTSTPIWPTPAVVQLAAQRLITEPIVPVTTPFGIVDVGGATTDVVYCAELDAHDTPRPACDEGVVRQVFTDLGVVRSLPALRHRLATAPGVFELAAAIAPDCSRALYHAMCDGELDALAPPVGFLACLFLALRRLTDTAHGHRFEPGRAAGFVITGRAWIGAADSDIRRVVGTACRLPDARWSVHVDREYALWAHGLLAVPAQGS